MLQDDFKVRVLPRGTGHLTYLANNVRYLILHAVETFVDPSRFLGTCYRAAG